MKKIKRGLCSILMLVVLVVVLGKPSLAQARYYDTGNEFYRKEGGILGIGATEYRYRIWKDTNDGYRIYNALEVCPPIYHSQYSGSKNLSYSCTQTYSSETAYNFSVGVGCSVGIAELVSLTAQKAGGLTKTYGKQFSATGQVGATIPSNASTGYYKMSVCYNYYNYMLNKHKGDSKAIYQSYFPAVPYGTPYVAVLYSTSSEPSSYYKY